MEAPEKIYIQESCLPGIDEIGFYSQWTSVPIEEKCNIEYTRTKAFIKKIWNWIDENFHESEIDTKYGESANCVISELGMCIFVRNLKTI